MRDPVEWWQRFFTGPWLDVQGSMYDDSFTAGQVDRIEMMLGLQPRSRILDVPAARAECHVSSPRAGIG